MLPLSGLLGFEGFAFEPLPFPLESEGFSTGVVTCQLSSSEPPLEPSEQEGNVNARLRARIKAVATRGGSGMEVDFHFVSIKIDLLYIYNYSEFI